MCTPPSCWPQSRVDIEGLLHFGVDILEVARLDPVRQRVRVAVHRVADPHRLAAFRPHVLDQRGQGIGNLARRRSGESR